MISDTYLHTCEDRVMSRAEIDTIQREIASLRWRIRAAQKKIIYLENLLLSHTGKLPVGPAPLDRVKRVGKLED